MGDLVIFIQDSGKVPITTRGRLVFLTRTTGQSPPDAAFDHPFMSSARLSHMCSQFSEEWHFRSRWREPIGSKRNFIKQLESQFSTAASENSRLHGYSSSPRGGGGGRTATLPTYRGSRVRLQRPQFSADDSRTVPPPANLNTPTRGRTGRGGGRGRGGGGN